MADHDSAPKQDPGLPACGIYRTTRPLAGHSEEVRAGALVYFHSHSKQGPPIVLLPASNTNNRWTFHTHGYLVNEEEFPGSLVVLPREGFYILRSAIKTEKGSLKARSLVQLGYNAKADPILFLGSVGSDNAIHFPTRGFRFNDDIFKELEPAGFELRAKAGTDSEPESRVLH